MNCRFRRAGWLLGAALLAALRPAIAPAQFPQWSTFPLQYPDARVLPRGLLQVAFLPSYAHYDSRFDSTGSVQPLGQYLSVADAGSDFLPSIAGVEAALRRVLGDSSYRARLGSVRLPLDADVRRFPLDLALGLTGWLTVGARVPLVKTRIQGVLRLDAASANVGLNPAAAAAGDPAAAAQLAALLAQLEAAIARLQAGLAQGTYAGALSLLGRAQRLRDLLRTLTTPSAAGGGLAPVAPLASSAAGQALRAELQAVADSLAALGAGAVSSTLPLPTAPLDSAAIQRIVTDPEFGYQLLPLATPRRTYTIGDAELFFRLGLLQRERLRAVATALVRLPTGVRQSSAHVFNLGTGDRQWDLEGGLELAWEPGRLGLSGTLGFTHQFSDRLTLRWAPPEHPIAPAAYTYLTDRQLGDVLRAAVYPSLALTEGFRVYGSVYYWRKAEDRYRLAGGADPVPGTPGPADLARGSGGQSLSLGAGVFYRAASVRRDSTVTETLPVEAGASYQAAFAGSGGLVPKSTMLNLYLRLYFRLLGKPRD